MLSHATDPGNIGEMPEPVSESPLDDRPDDMDSPVPGALDERSEQDSTD